MKVTSTLLKSTVVAALGGLLFGFDTAVIAGATAGLTRTFSLNPRTLGWTVAIALVGTVIGALVAGIPGDRYGRRDSLRGLAVLYLLSAAGCAFAWDWYSLVFFRFIGGLAIGGSSVLGPMYIAEIAPAKLRGRLVGFLPVQRRRRHSRRVSLQLPDRPCRFRGERVALDARCLWHPRALLLRYALHHPAQPALAGPEIALA